VRLASDYQIEDRVFDNVRAHVASADGFIAEITDLNPNVMLELGAALFQDKTRPVVCLRAKSGGKDVPADIIDYIRVEYDREQRDDAALASNLSDVLCPRGSITHDAFRRLVRARRRRYLSKSILRSLAVRLDERQVAQLQGLCVSIEDFQVFEIKELIQRAMIPEHIVHALRGELQAMTSQDAPQ
jgi:hypothetical protein